MHELTHADIRAHLGERAVPAEYGELLQLAERLCLVQQTLAPVTSPRRLVLFAAEYDARDECESAPALRDLVSDGSVYAVLGHLTNTFLVLVDVGTHAPALAESAHYRCRKVRAGAESLTADEFRAAFVVGQKEAELAAKDGTKVVAAEGVCAASAEAADRVLAVLRGNGTSADPVAAFAPACGPDIAAAAGFFARAAELKLTVFVCGPFAQAAVAIAEQLYPETAGRVVEPFPCRVFPGSAGCGYPGAAGASANDAERAGLLAFPFLDAAAALVARTTPRHTRASAAPKQRRVAVFTGSFDPPTTFHRRVATALRGRGFDEVIVRPSGRRCDSPDGEHATPIHRAVMADLAFRGLPGVSVDLGDLDDATFTPHVSFDDLYTARGEVWQVISSEFLTDGRSGQSAIHTKWECGDDVWRTGRFVVLHPTDEPPDPLDLPAAHLLVPTSGHVPTADIRFRVFQHGDASPDVPADVAAYIRRYRLFSGAPAPRETHVRLRDVRLKIVFDEMNPKARSLAERFKHLETTDPTHVLVIGGDGTMLAAIREHWRLRLPFIGLNAGTLGFLMNESLSDELEGMEVLMYHMPMLRADADTPDGRRLKCLAFGDAWMERNSGQAAWMRVDVDGRTQVPKVVGDGLLVATPSGSSAYARAMGATPVPLTAPVLTLAGSNVFRPRFWKPVALPESSSVTLTSLDTTGKRPLRGFIDGLPIGLVKSLYVRASSVAAVELVFTPEFDLSARLLRSLFPPDEVR